MMEGADRTYDYIQKVAQFYRYNMKKSEETVTVADEVEMVDSYSLPRRSSPSSRFHFP